MKGRKSQNDFWKWPTPKQPNEQEKWNWNRGRLLRQEVPSFFAGNQTGTAKANGSNLLE
jgi:hypothetical protein